MQESFHSHSARLKFWGLAYVLLPRVWHLLWCLSTYFISWKFHFSEIHSLFAWVISLPVFLRDLWYFPTLALWLENRGHLWRMLHKMVCEFAFMILLNMYMHFCYICFDKTFSTLARICMSRCHLLYMCW